MYTETDKETLDSDKLAVIEFLNKIGINKVVFGDYDQSINGTPLLLHSDNKVEHPHISVNADGFKIDYTFRFLRKIDDHYSVGTDIRTHGYSEYEIIKNYSLTILEEEIMGYLKADKSLFKIIRNFLKNQFDCCKKLRFRHTKPR